MRKQGFRRYPALAYLLAAGALALLLPSGLIVPQSGPPTLAEYAPVTGQGAGEGNSSELGQASSEALGVLPGSGPGEVAGKSESGRVVKKRGTKNCVGKPPRQTEDLLSPPCIAFFDGDNGGATSKGVTKDEIRLVMFGNGQNEPRSGQSIDCSEPPRGDDPPELQTCKAFARFFGSRYQTYNRVVKIWLYLAPTNQYGVELDTVVERHNPFGIIAAGRQGNGTTVAASAGRRGMLGAAYESGTRKTHADYSPYAIAFKPDFENILDVTVSFVCLKLKDRNVAFSDNPLQRTKRRVFGVMDVGDPQSYFGPLIVRLLRERCDIEVAERTRTSDPAGPSRMQAKDVTTVIFVPNTSGQALLATNNASKDGFFPEWVVAGDYVMEGIDTNAQARTVNQSQWKNAIGVTFDYRRDSITEQLWYRNYKEGCSECVASDVKAPYIYDAFSMMFYGIQAAGPRLTPANFDRGMHSIAQDRSVSPYKPAAYFEPGNYTFVKDSAMIWWDPTGRAPGDPGAGCYKLSSGGRRFRAGEFTSSDQDIRNPDDPCQGSASQ